MQHMACDVGSTVLGVNESNTQLQAIRWLLGRPHSKYFTFPTCSGAWLKLPTKFSILSALSACTPPHSRAQQAFCCCDPSQELFLLTEMWSHLLKLHVHEECSTRGSAQLLGAFLVTPNGPWTLAGCPSHAPGPLQLSSRCCERCCLVWLSEAHVDFEHPFFQSLFFIVGKKDAMKSSFRCFLRGISPWISQKHKLERWWWGWGKGKSGVTGPRVYIFREGR